MSPRLVCLRPKLPTATHMNYQLGCLSSAGFCSDGVIDAIMAQRGIISDPLKDMHDRQTQALQQIYRLMTS